MAPINPPSPPNPVPPVISYAIAAVVTLVGLVASGGLISNHTEKLVAGLASVGLPLIFVLANSLLHLGHARVQAARILAQAPVNPAVTHRPQHKP